MYTLHIANKNYSSWSLRPWVLMRTLSIPFEEKISPFPTGSSWEQFRNFSPTGLVPCLEDGDQIVWDSLAIAEYLGEKENGVWPDGVAARTWARCAAAEMHSGFFDLRGDCGMSCGVRIKLHEVSGGLQKDLDRLDELWQQGLTQFGGPFLAGEKFTAVDAFFAPVAFRIRTYGLQLSDPSLAYAQRLLDLDAMQNWNNDALKEPWFEPGHEKQILNAGELLEDLRTPNV